MANITLEEKLAELGLLTKDEVVAYFKGLCDMETQAIVGKRLGRTQAFMSTLTLGRESLGDKTARSIGFERIVRYRKIEG